MKLKQHTKIILGSIIIAGIIALGVLIHQVKSIALGSINPATIPLSKNQQAIEIRPNEKLTVRFYGRKSSPTILLLHGFPETSYVWERLGNDLAKSGYYVIAPDQRGYSPGLRPLHVNDYVLSNLIDDMKSLADVLNIERFHVIGHDWGGVVASMTTAKLGNRIISLTCLSVCHPKALFDAYNTSTDQYAASAYMRNFKWPYFAEYWMAKDDYQNLMSIWPRDLPSIQKEAYLNVFKQKGALTAAVNWYRANLKNFVSGKIDDEIINVPTLYLWGTRDTAVLQKAVKQNESFFSDYQFQVLDAGHWLTHDAYQNVRRSIVKHLKANH